MKKLSLLVMLAMVLMGTLAGCSSSTSTSTTEQETKQETKQETVELKMAHFLPATHPMESQFIQAFAKDVAASTNGQVKITSYPGQTLLKGPDTYDGVVNAIADIGLSVFEYSPGRFPIIAGFEVPGIVYNSSKAASAAGWEGIKQLNPKEVQDTKLLMVFSSGPNHMFTKTPVKSLEDLKGMNIRTTGASSKTLQKLGANPVAMSQPETYEALSKGIVKGNVSSFEPLKTYKQAEVTKYITRAPFLKISLWFVTMNLDKWNSLSPENQKVIETLSKKYYEEVVMGMWDKLNADALKFALEENGMEEINLTPEETDRWMAAIKPLQDEYIAEMNKKNLPGQQVLETAKSLAEKYNKEYK